MAAAQDARRTLRRARAAPGVSFGYLFRWAEDARDDADADARLAALAAAMSEDECDPGRAASGLPLIVPLFGQFLEHDLAAAAEMKAFVGKHRGVLQSARGGAVPQLASQEPDDSSVHRAWAAGRGDTGTHLRVRVQHGAVRDPAPGAHTGIG